MKIATRQSWQGQNHWKVTLRYVEYGNVRDMAIRIWEQKQGSHNYTKTWLTKYIYIKVLSPRPSFTGFIYNPTNTWPHWWYSNLQTGTDMIFVWRFVKKLPTRIALGGQQTLNVIGWLVNHVGRHGCCPGNLLVVWLVDHYGRGRGIVWVPFLQVVLKIGIKLVNMLEQGSTTCHRKYHFTWLYV